MTNQSYEEAIVQTRLVQEKVLASISDNLRKEEERIPSMIARSSGKSVFNDLARLYAFMDRLYSSFSGEIPCGKGCNHCCSLKEIAITEIEILYIEKHANKKRLIRPRDLEEVSYQPCPFLKEDICSIYPYRPYVCRKHFSMSPVEWCQPGTCESFEFPQMSFAGIEEGLAILLQRSGKMKVRDIRAVFSERGAP